MLESIRRGQRWLTAIFISVIGVVFVFFIGLGGPLRENSPSGNAVVQLDHIRVSPADYQRARAGQEERFRDGLGDQFGGSGAQSFIDAQAIVHNNGDYAATFTVTLTMINEAGASAGSIEGEYKMPTEYGIEPGEEVGESLVDAIVLLDREVDTITPFCTQLTYEGLMEEILGIKNGVVTIKLRSGDEEEHASSEDEGEGGNSPKKILKSRLCSNDILFM